MSNIPSFHKYTLKGKLYSQGKDITYKEVTHPRAASNSLVLKAYIPGADPGFGVRGDEIRQGDLRVLLLLFQMFMESMMQEN